MASLKSQQVAVLTRFGGSMSVRVVLANSLKSQWLAVLTGFGVSKSIAISKFTEIKIATAAVLLLVQYRKPRSIIPVLLLKLVSSTRYFNSSEYLYSQGII